MPKEEVPVFKGRRYKSEKVDISKSESFSIPERNPGHIPSLPSRAPVRENKTRPVIGVPNKDIPFKVEQDLAIASSKVVPVPPLPPRVFPTKKKEERVPNLSELI